MIKDRAEHPGGGDAQNKVCGEGRGASIRLLPLPRTSMCLPTQKLSKLHAYGIFMGASSHRHDPSLTQSSAPHPFPEDGGVRLNVPTFYHGLVFPVTGTPSRTHPESPHENRRHTNPPGRSMRGRTSVSETGSKTNTRIKGAPNALTT